MQKPSEHHKLTSDNIIIKFKSQFIKRLKGVCLTRVLVMQSTGMHPKTKCKQAIEHKFKMQIHECWLTLK